MTLQRHSDLSNDTIIGVFFSAMVAFGLAIISRERSLARDLQRFLYGDILTINDGQILCLMGLFLMLMGFQALSYNRLLYIGLDQSLAKAHRIRVASYQYIFAAFLSLTVMFSVQAIGVLLVTALLIVPAAAARNLAGSAGSMFWWTLLISISSAISGLLFSAQDWARTASGATIILVTCAWFLLSLLVPLIRRR